MGIFDSKKVKEEKKLYNNLLALREQSMGLKNILPKSFQEFQNSRNKERIANVYNYFLEIRKRDDIKNAFKLNTDGAVYDFIERYYNSYCLIKNGNGMDFLSYLDREIKLELAVYEGNLRVKEEEKKVAEGQVKMEQMIDELNGRMAQLDKAPGAVKARNMAMEEANYLMKQMENKNKEREFASKFPEYSDLRHLASLYSLGIYGEENKEKIDRIIDIGKSFSDDFFFGDILLPYIREKEYNSILLNNLEKEIYSKRKDCDIEKYFVSMRIIAKLYYNNGRYPQVKQNRFMSSFNWYNNFIRETRERNNQSSGRGR